MMQSLVTAVAAATVQSLPSAQKYDHHYANQFSVRNIIYKSSYV